MSLPFSEACERNKEPLLKVLKEIIRPQHRKLLEIGAGTGQHAVYFAPFFPKLEWTATDRAENLPDLNRRVQESRIPNLKPPHKLEVGEDDFSKLTYDIVFTANTFHIMHWKECKTLMKLLGHRLEENGLVIIYGPFNYGGKFTSDSNEEFDRNLKARDPLSGLRAFEDVDKAMVKNGFQLLKDFEMPANNRTLVYRRLKFVRPVKPAL